MFCRPKRFGKSLLIDMLKSYHGVAFADSLEETFEGLHIGNKDIQKMQFWWLHRKWLQVPDNLLSNRQRDNSKYPEAAFRVTFDLVRKYMWENGTKAVNGVYVLVDLEDDYATNYHLQHHSPDDVRWQRTPLGIATDHFWTSLERHLEDHIGRVFVTGVTPVATASGIILTNISFNPEFSGLCGPNRADVAVAMDKMGVGSDASLEALVKYTNGYHFDQYAQVTPVFNTSTCLAAIQELRRNRVVTSEDAEISLQNSKLFDSPIEAFATDSNIIHQLVEAIGTQDDGFTPIEYQDIYFRSIGSSDLYGLQQTMLLKLLVYYGVLSFDPHEPTKLLRIPNHTVAAQVAASIMEWGGLCTTDLTHALQALGDPMNVIRVLDMYRLMLATDAFKNKLFTPIIIEDDTHGDGLRVSITVETSTDLILLVLKRIPVDSIDLSSRIYGNSLEREAFIQQMPTEELLPLTINHRKGRRRKPLVVEDFVKHTAVPQLRSSLNSANVQEMATKKNLRLSGYAVVIVGDRQILVTRLRRDGKDWKVGSISTTNSHTEETL
ncbi:hypothetical protein EV421DRAFT_1900162 [Armillaria borealis]|uniref:AAA-ATPase-like domain-containing protein n=1 Tax=Armillaria borealis TaxID=47425 RepID=A0AA39MXH6_9AGAR|nr:hypothetical protein EV421DRAFT_1900162 [Armillaria borealis]